MWIDLMCPLQISPRLHHWNIVEWQVVALWPKLRRCWRMAFKRRGRIQHSLRPLPLTHLKEKSRHLEPQRNDIGITWHDWAWGAWNLELQRRQSHRNWSSHQSSWHSSCAQSYGKWKIIVFFYPPLGCLLENHALAGDEREKRQPILESKLKTGAPFHFSDFQPPPEETDHLFNIWVWVKIRYPKIMDG